MKQKTSELTGPALDWAVANCGDVELMSLKHSGRALQYDINGQACWDYWNPSTDWAQGGPIIEQGRINLYRDAGAWTADMPDSFFEVGGDTPLIAAMRCYVASKLGDEIDIPAGL